MEKILRQFASISIIIPVYDDLSEALDLIKITKPQLVSMGEIEWIIIALDPACASGASCLHLPPGVTLHSSKAFRGLPRAKNLGLQASDSDLVLFLFPGILPGSKAVEHLVRQMCRHPDWGGISGRWNAAGGQVEKGYNLRRYPTFPALLYDLLFINKIVPSNAVTRGYKMHDFDYNTLCMAEHVNDCAFISRRRLLQALGGFNESYEFGWFDQVEMCHKMNQCKHPIYYDPGAVFTSTDREPLVNRMLARHYTAFYEDESRFVIKTFGRRCHRVFRIALAIGMTMRLIFSCIFPQVARSWILRRYGSYVDDNYIQDMRGAYGSMLKAMIAPKHRKAGAP